MLVCRKYLLCKSINLCFLSFLSGCLIDDLSSIVPQKATACNLLIKNNISNKRKQFHSQRGATESNLPKCIVSMNNDDSLATRSNLRLRAPKPQISTESCEECREIESTPSNSKNDRSEVVIDDEDELSNTVIQPDDHNPRSDLLKDKKLDAPAKNKITTLSSNSTHTELVISPATDPKILPNFIDDLSKRSLSDSIPIPSRMEGRRQIEEYFEDSNRESANDKINQLRAIEASIERHNASNMLTYVPDEKQKDDGLALYVSPLLREILNSCNLENTNFYGNIS